MANNYDAIFVVPFFEQFVTDRRLCGTASRADMRLEQLAHGEGRA
jgi:hypothetical protein